MIRTFLGTLVGLVLALQVSVVCADQGRLLKVVDGDTFMLEVDDVRGPKTIEVNLVCSDAPILSAPFGQESRQQLQTFLKQASSIHYKTQAYCGSESCVEALVYIPDPLTPEITYINTRMIATGMARNKACRGAFSKAEEQAKSAKTGIWSTSRRIAYAEVQKTPQPKPEVTTSKQVLTQQTSSAPAIIDVNRADRTVTLKSRELSLSKAVAAIDTVSTVPVSLYLVEDQYIAISLDKVPWYEALQRVVDLANLKQVNMNGKVDLYDQLFYYKHIAPYLKLADDGGGYISVANGSKETPAVDDGVTRYVFINEYENSAEVAKAQQQSQHGYVQVHKGISQEPAVDHGRFEVSGVEQEPVAAAPAAPSIELPPPLKPYSGEKELVAQQTEAPAEAARQPATVAAEPAPAAVVKATQEAEEKSAVAEPVVTTPAQPEPAAEKEPPPVPSEKTQTAAADKAADSDKPAAEEPVLNIQIERSEAIALVVVIFVVVFGAVFLSRSAASRAAKAEQGVDPGTLVKQEEAAADEPAPEPDADYEKEIFEGLDHAADGSDASKVVDELFDTDNGAPDEPPVAAVTAEPVDAPPGPDAAQDAAEAVAADAEQPEEAVPESQAPQPVEEALPGKPEQEPAQQKKKPARKKIKGVAKDEGNYAVTLDDYERLMKPPKREPRKDCLFEVTSTRDGKSASGIGLDISSGGMFVDSKESYAVGMVLDLEFKLAEDDPQPVRCRCGVTWVNSRPDPIKPNYPNGYGVCFLEMEDSTRKALDAFIEEQEVESEEQEAES